MFVQLEMMQAGRQACMYNIMMYVHTYILKHTLALPANASFPVQ